MKLQLPAARIAAAALLLACCPAPFRTAPERLAQWTTSLRDEQPDDAFAAVYKTGKRHLVFIGARHANRTDSLTFELIRNAYSAFRVDATIVEGSPTSRGPNFARLIEYASSAKVTDGFQEGGETIPAVMGAVQEGATLWGGEPDDADIKTRMLGEGFPSADLLGFYVLRSIPEWIREKKLTEAGDPRLASLVEKELARNRQRLALGPDVLPSFTDWADWYKATNGKPIGPSFAMEETGPLSDGAFPSNRIAAAISRARAAYLHEFIISHLNAGETVLVVFGSSHLMIHRTALDAVLGSPCYVGSDIAAAAKNCAG
ncbi:hypothetical protein [Sphingosinicella sp. BN140058]|uniref:hypothetical protein n=1 Tax=Sphingosinicella sp. BN140058 TaxID=1892855 RepID=UPI001011B188|nr:hypothetical protein [Sphingosinicella sp. BN140058]QAY78293.1 hypothetical protein ETR14_18430 [Sphingosinicella sp. BN140058]